MKKQSKWIWIKSWKAEDKEEPALVLFRRAFRIAGEPEKAVLKISADSRYKLYINGKLIEIGPSRGDSQVWFFDEIDFLSYLTEGENVLAVQVLRYPLAHEKGNHGIFRTGYPGLYLEGEVQYTDGSSEILNADEKWKVRKDEGFSIVSESDDFAPLQIYERKQGSEELKGWMLKDYDDSRWEYAFEYSDMNQAVSPGNLLPRTIPYLYRKERTFQEVMVLRKSVLDRKSWENLLWNRSPLLIPAHSEEIVEISAGEEMTGYLHLSMLGGKNTKITILQSESYVMESAQGRLSMKNQRDDWKNGRLDGFYDTYRVDGYGTEELPEEYEPFWFRTFRFIRLEIHTEEEPLILSRFNYTETGYPLEVKTQVEISDPSLKAIWDMSERTLRRCMHETYEDCPFYEQLQYAMDARQQILYTYSVSADDRLARKCMDDFRRSQRYDGLLNCSYPCYGPNVIPGFSIYYILMLYDHMMYFGDRELLEEHMPTVERILDYFHRNRENGYVRKIGGLNGERFWSFVDWTPEWDATTGVPPATLSGAITMESLLYIMGLKYAAEITEYLGRAEQTEAYRLHAENVKQAVRRYCVGKEGLLQDGPGVEQYSQHTQVFAVLTDTIEAEQGRSNLKRTLLDKDKYPQCSVAMSFYLFRALEKAGLYEWSEQYWGIWKRMLKKGATTCVEDEVRERSDCHAWGALILYEFPSVLLGVRPARAGYEAVMIRPETGYLQSAKGSIMTPKGMIRVEWSKEENLMLKYEVPENLEVIQPV